MSGKTNKSDAFSPACRAMSRFTVVSGVARFFSHALGNPLAGLSLSLELLATGPLSETQRRLVERCLHVSERLAFLQENLGALGDAGCCEHFAQIDCEAFCHAVVEQQGLGDAYDVHIEVMPGGERVVAHPGLLAEALGYLLRNSRDASPQGGSLGIRVAPVPSLGTTDQQSFLGVRFTVWDLGPGMPSDFYERLFFEPQTSHPHGGGTGLILVAMIVEDVHHGRISFAPEGGPGDNASVAHNAAVEIGAADMAKVSGCRFHLDLPGRSA